MNPIENKIEKISPFLKWPGGKRWIAEKITEIIKKNSYQTYYEPFLGGGAVFFDLRPQKAILSDINADLINVYQQVQNNYAQLIIGLKKMKINEITYYKVRNWNPINNKEKAIRFLYLNRTAFGGLYRLNKKGKFNVPFGGGERDCSILWEKKLLEKASIGLDSAIIRQEDFSFAFDNSAAGDVIYCDPTYTVAHNSNAFVRYNEKNFSWDDQVRLSNYCQAAINKGTLVIVTNAWHPSVLSLYNFATIIEINRQSLVSKNKCYRRSVNEALIICEPNNT